MHAWGRVPCGQYGVGWGCSSGLTVLGGVVGRLVLDRGRIGVRDPVAGDDRVVLRIRRGIVVGRVVVGRVVVRRFVVRRFVVRRFVVRRFVARRVVVRRFVAVDRLIGRRFVVRRFVVRRFVAVDRFVVRRFVVRRFVAGRFVAGRFVVFVRRFVAGRIVLRGCVGDIARLRALDVLRPEGAIGPLDVSSPTSSGDAASVPLQSRTSWPIASRSS